MSNIISKNERLSMEIHKINRALNLISEGKTLSESARLIKTSYTALSRALTSERHRAEYAQARERGFDALADSLLTVHTTERDVAKARLQSENIKWLLARRAAQVYGDKLDVSVSGQIDITSALLAANERMRTISHDPLAIEHSQVIENNEEIDNIATDNESVGKPEAQKTSIFE